MNTIEQQVKQSIPGSLRCLKNGDYLLVDSSGLTMEKLPDGTEALLLEQQGTCHDRECWYALANGRVIVVWQDNFID